MGRLFLKEKILALPKRWKWNRNGEGKWSIWLPKAWHAFKFVSKRRSGVFSLEKEFTHESSILSRDFQIFRFSILKAKENPTPTMFYQRPARPKWSQELLFFFRHLFSTGVGRSGTFCAVCAAIDRIEAESAVDIFQIVKAMRLQRPMVIRTLVRVTIMITLL